MHSPSPPPVAARGRRGLRRLGQLALLGASLLAARELWRLPWTRYLPPPRLSPVTAVGALRPPLDRARVLFIGHSLVNTEMPAMLQSIAASLGCAVQAEVQLRSGACLQVSWHRQGAFEGIDARAALASGAYDALVMTEAVDLDDMLRWMQPAEHASLFQALAVAHRPDVRVFLYETWHDRALVRRTLYAAPRAAGWRQFLDEDLGKWEGIAVGAAERTGLPRMALVPAGQALARLADACRRGEVPGVADEGSLFADGIHLMPLGNYFVALVQFATLLRRSPAGATPNPVGADGVQHTFAPATAAALQQLAWAAICDYAWSGVREDG